MLKAKKLTWTLQDVWVANKTATDVEVVEENQRYTKLAFPAKLNGTWNYTAHVDTVEVDYQYTAYDASVTLNGNSFTKTLTAALKNPNSSAITYQNYYEQYARGIGLICKHVEDYQYSQAGGYAHPGVIVGGTYYVMTVNSYGTE